MRHLLPFALVATLLVAASPAHARDSRLHLDVAAAIAAGQADGTLDGSVRFHFRGAPALGVVDRHGPAGFSGIVYEGVPHDLHDPPVEARSGGPLAAAGERPGIAQRMQTRWPVLLGVTAAAVIGLTLFYRYGTPWAATQLTRFVPISWETSVAENVLQQMDNGTLKPSKLPSARQDQLKARFDALVQQTPPGLQRYSGYRPPLSLEFRSGMGANAFALPGGKIVMTDGIVKAAADKGLDDNALVGVLAHEVGHVVQRHTTRMVVQQGVLNMGLGLALGDVSGIVSTGASLLTGLAYSRSHEREADCYAIAVMRHAALPTAPMGQLLLAIARDEDNEEAQKKDQGKGPTTAASAPSSGASTPDAARQRKVAQEIGSHPVWSLLSSHPDTVERATELERGQAPHCAKN